MRLIDADAAIEALTRLGEGTTTYFGIFVDVSQITEMIKALPSAQPERMRAKWIATTSLQEGQITWRDYKCSNCSHHRSKPMNFCEVCGAKMER